MGSHIKTGNYKYFLLHCNNLVIVKETEIYR